MDDNSNDANLPACSLSIVTSTGRTVPSKDDPIIDTTPNRMSSIQIQAVMKMSVS